MTWEKYAAESERLRRIMGGAGEMAPTEARRHGEK